MASKVAPEPIADSQRDPDSDEDTGQEPRRRPDDTLFTWRYWKPIFIVFVSVLTLLDQVMDHWLLLNYALNRHWGWFLIAGCSALLTSTIAGLFAFIDDDIRSLTWLPRFFRENPFFVGFLLLHVPTATAAACKGALEVHESEKRNLHRSKRRAVSSDGGLPYVDPLFLDVPARSTNGSQALSHGASPKYESEVKISGNVLSGVIAQHMEQQGGDADAQELEVQRANYRMSVIMEVRSLTATSDAAKRAVSTVEWTRFVQALFQDILGLALQVYIVVLVRERDYVRFVSIGLACFSMAINVALMFGDKQPFLRRFVVFLHVTGQLMMRMVMFAYLSVARAEKAVPLLLTFAAAALLFSTHLHSHSGWVIATIFTFPISFLAWQSTNSRDLFGWKVNGAMDYATTNLRLMIAWRFLENLGGIATVLWLPTVNPCTPAASDVRYLSEDCTTCCRGPIMYFEFLVAVAISSSMYVLSWVAGWMLDNFYFASEY